MMDYVMETGHIVRQRIPLAFSAPSSLHAASHDQPRPTGLPKSTACYEDAFLDLLGELLDTSGARSIDMDGQFWKLKITTK